MNKDVSIDKGECIDEVFNKDGTTKLKAGRKANSEMSDEEFYSKDYNSEMKRFLFTDEVLCYAEYKDLLYSPNSGQFYRVRFNTDNNVDIIYKIFPSDEYKINTKRSSSKSRTFKNPNYLAWEIINRRDKPQKSVVYAKDLDNLNLRMNNICIMLREDYRKLRDALDNCNGALKLTMMVNLKFKVSFKQNGNKRVRVFFDETDAKEFYRELKIHDTKLVSMFHVSKDDYN